MRHIKENIEYLDRQLARARELLDASAFAESADVAREAISGAVDARDRQREAAATNILGAALLRGGETDEARKLFEYAAELAVQIEDVELEVACLTNLARHSRLVGETGQALRLCERALHLARGIDKPLTLATTLLVRGNVLERMGAYREALKDYAEALEIASSRGAVRIESYASGNLGIVYERLGDTALALRHNIRSLELKEQENDRWGMGVSYNNIGTLYNDLGEYASALESFLRSLEITEAINDREGMSAALNGVAHTYEAMNEEARVLEYYSRSLAIAREIGYVQGQAFSLTHMGHYYALHGDFTRALLHHYRSLRLFESTNDRYGIRGVLQYIGECYSELGDDSRAIACYDRGLAIARDTGDRMGLSAMLQALGALHNRNESYAEAITSLTEALEIARTDGYRELERAILGTLGDAYDAAGDRLAASTCHKAYAACTEALFNERSKRRAAELLYRFETNDVRRMGVELGLSDDDVAMVVNSLPRQRRATVGTGTAALSRAAPIPTVRVTALGSLHVAIEGHEIGHGDWGRRRARDLFCLLLLRHRRVVSFDDVLISLFGIEESSERTRALVMNAISHVRRALEPERLPHARSLIVIASGGGYLLDLGDRAWVDFLRFKELIVDARRAGTLSERVRLYEEAVDLYRGDLFVEDPYAEWCATERDMIRDAWLESLEYLAAEDLRAGRYDDAIERSRRGLQADPTAERSCATLITALAAKGRTGEASQVREAFAAAWRAEHGTAPPELLPPVR